MMHENRTQMTNLNKKLNHDFYLSAWLVISILKDYFTGGQILYENAQWN